MTTSMSVRDALALVPGLDLQAVEVRTLSGGLSNRSFLIEHGSERWVLRLDSGGPRAFEPDRALEMRAQQMAAAAGLAPAVIFADPSAGVLISRYVAGRSWTAADLADDRKLSSLATRLRDVHALPLCGTRISMPETAMIYRRYIERHGPWHEFASRCVEVISAVTPPESISFCHNDIVAGNIVANGAPVLIDWEFASDNAPLFDLASLIGFHDLDERQVDVLLEAYTGKRDPVASGALADQCILYDAIQWLWLAARQAGAAVSGDEARLLQLQERILAAA